LFIRGGFDTARAGMSAAAALDDIKQRMDETQKNDVQTRNMPEKRTRKESVRGTRIMSTVQRREGNRTENTR
jgi:hypothetical protein